MCIRRIFDVPSDLSYGEVVAQRDGLRVDFSKHVDDVRYQILLVLGFRFCADCDESGFVLYDFASDLDASEDWHYGLGVIESIDDLIESAWLCAGQRSPIYKELLNWFSPLLKAADEAGRPEKYLEIESSFDAIWQDVWDLIPVGLQAQMILSGSSLHAHLMGGIHEGN